jgi:amino acid transporter
MGTMNVYTGSSAKLAAALASDSALPSWLAGDAHRSVPRRPLILLGGTAAVMLVALAAGMTDTVALVRGTSACFLVVYVLSLGAATRILTGITRAAAVVSLVLVGVVVGFSSTFLAVPLVAALASLGYRRFASRDRGLPRVAADRGH